MEKKTNDLEERLEIFAQNVLSLVRVLPKSLENKIYGHQVIRSSSSMGANYAEATTAQSRPDFANDLNRVRKEAKEPFYWLKLIRFANPSFGQRVNPLISECEEFIKMFSSASKKLKSK